MDQVANVLLLYEFTEKDLARDLSDFLGELNVGPITMIALSPDKGLTLDAKEQHYFDSAGGALFLITPGSERLGGLFPSPSVSHEMGQAKQKFRQKPENVVYLVEQHCNMPAVDQTARIIFDRTDVRSIISALTQVIRNLKAAGIFSASPVRLKASQSKVTMVEFVAKLNDHIRAVVFDLSQRPNGIINDRDFARLIREKYRLNEQSVNFLKRDLQKFKVVAYQIMAAPPHDHRNIWHLTELGWDVASFLAVAKKTEGQKTMTDLANFLRQGKVS